MGADDRNDYGLTARDMATILSTLRRFPAVQEVVLFGSRAMGTFRKGSDIDLSVMNIGIEKVDFNALQEAFEESSLAYRVEVHYFPSISDLVFKTSILRWGKNIYTSKRSV